MARFQDEIQPILIDYCYRCHADGMKKGEVAFDQGGSDEALVKRRELWWAVLKNVRAGIMPPAGKPRPTDKEVEVLADWIKHDVFGIDPKDPDPGRVTIRRLNRVEYRNTIRDLMGIDFKAEEEFPPDDTGYGFDNIGDVLSVSPLLLEKYFQAAESIVKAAVPTASKTHARAELSRRRVPRRGEGPERRPNGVLQAGEGLAVARTPSPRATIDCCSSWPCRAPTSSTRAVARSSSRSTTARSGARPITGSPARRSTTRSTSTWPPATTS